MKLNKIFLASAILCGQAFLLSSCDDELDRPPVIEPMATYQPNTTIAQLKQTYWQADDNYYTPILTTATGDSIIISGRVVSNDAAGNIYRQIVIEDETGAMDFSVTMNDINTKYYFGQEVRVNVTGMIIGKYAGLMRVGAIYNGSIGRMDESQFTTHAQVNRLPNAALVDTTVVTLDELASYKSTTEGLIRWQSRLIRLNDMTFPQGGRTTLGTPGSSANGGGTSVTLRDASGKTIDVRTSNLCDLASLTVPTGTGSVTAILGYFGSNWQLTLLDAAGLEGFDETPAITPPNPGESGDGSSDNPFTADAVISGTAAGTGVWVTGYIVGCINSNTNPYSYEFTAPFNYGSNMLIASTPTETVLENCVPVQLSKGSTIYTALNLLDNPTNHGKQVTIQGNIENYFSQPGLKTTTAYNWGGTGGTGSGDVPVTGTATFSKATDITSGASYVMMVGDKVGKVIASTYSYGRLELTAPAAATADEITTDAANAITITAVTGGYTMVDAYGRYLSMDADHPTSFQLYTSQEAGSVWAITPAADGTMTIENTFKTGCFVGQSGIYTNIAPAQSTDVNRPVFYKKVEPTNL